MRKLQVGAAFGHSVKSAFNNLKFAFDVSWPWLLLLVPVNVFTTIYYQTHPFAPGVTPVPGQILIGLASGILELVVFASIAVAWHRYILKDEVPQTIGQRLRVDSVVMRYLGISFLVWLRVIGMTLLGYLPFLIVFALSSLSKVLAGLLGVAYFLAFVVYFLWMIGAAGRWSIKLVSVAVGNDIPMAVAWEKSKDSHWQVVGLYLLFVLCAFGVSIVLAGVNYVGGASGNLAVLVVALSVQIMINWFFTIWGVTLLTSLYGFFIENREF